MLLRNIAPGVYFPGKSILHRLQARTKFLVMGWLVVVLLVARQWHWHIIPFLVMGLLVLAGCICSGIALHDLWVRTRTILFLTCLSLVLSSLFFVDPTGEKILVTLGPLRIPYDIAYWGLLTIEALAIMLLFGRRLPVVKSVWSRVHRFRGVLILALLAIPLFLVGMPAASTRIVTLGPIFITDDTSWLLLVGALTFLFCYILALLITMTTLPMALIEGLMLLLTPLRWLRLPVDDFALMALLALRFFPTLFDEAEQLFKAQSARGADFGSGTLRERIHSIGRFFVLLVQGAMRRAAELSTALEARGYASQGKQTRLHEIAFHWQDYCVLGCVFLSTGVALLLTWITVR